MADPAEQEAQLQQAENVVRRLLGEEHPHLVGVPSTQRLVSEVGLALPELDEIYFSALQQLGRRPPLDEGEVHAPINLNDPTVEELARHIALNCPPMSAAEQEAVLRPDPSVTTQGDAGLVSPNGDFGMSFSAAEDARPPLGDEAAPRRKPGLLGIAVLLAVIAVIVVLWLATRW